METRVIEWHCHENKAPKTNHNQYELQSLTWKTKPSKRNSNLENEDFPQCSIKVSIFGDIRKKFTYHHNEIRSRKKRGPLVFYHLTKILRNVLSNMVFLSFAIKTTGVRWNWSSKRMNSRLGVSKNQRLSSVLAILNPTVRLRPGTESVNRAHKSAKFIRKTGCKGSVQFLCCLSQSCVECCRWRSTCKPQLIRDESGCSVSEGVGLWGIRHMSSHAHPAAFLRRVCPERYFLFLLLQTNLMNIDETIGKMLAATSCKHF